ncbi:MAG: hypothetical protein M3320_07400 [Actinomycetota bacterium]|nr:hypothetical protein [Actinomycetota bacterium]MDQ5808487.1 hypothetical protein [Actinomycetota bacterium]
MRCCGGAGNDALAGSDGELDGGQGRDVVDHFLRDAPVVVDLGDPGPDGSAGPNRLDGEGGADTLGR